MMTQIKTYDKKTLNLYLSRATTKNIKGSIIMLHGIFSNMHESTRFDRYELKLNSLGFDVYRYNLRGHGDTTDSLEMSIIDMTQDLMDVYNHIKTKNYKSLNILASSFGASILLNALQINDIRFSKIILLNPVTEYISTFIKPVGEQLKGVFNKNNYEKLEEDGFFIGPNEVKISTRFYNELNVIKPELSIRELKSNCYVFHGDNDTAVDYKICKQLFKENKEINFYTIKGANHAFREDFAENYLMDAFNKLFI